jgi:hypothetical protein
MASRSCKDAVLAWLRRSKIVALDDGPSETGYGLTTIRRVVKELQQTRQIDMMRAMRQTEIGPRRISVLRLRTDRA